VPHPFQWTDVQLEHLKTVHCPHTGTADVSTGLCRETRAGREKWVIAQSFEGSIRLHSWMELVPVFEMPRTIVSGLFGVVISWAIIVVFDAFLSRRVPMAVFDWDWLIAWVWLTCLGRRLRLVDKHTSDCK